VLVQPLGIHSPTHSSTSKSNGGGNGHFLTDKNYEVIYLDNDDPSINVCRGNGSVITLDGGSHSAVIIKLVEHHYHYRPFNCSIQITAKGESLDGITAVVEEMDLREHEDDVRQPGGHWGSSVCVGTKQNDWCYWSIQWYSR
jgi:hypothetical protein